MSADLGRRVRTGFVWSAISSGVMRLGSLVVGIVLARILSPEDFGVFAIALMVQTILINLAELGLAADLVRHGDLRGRGPTITTIALVASGSLTLAMWWGAEPLATLMGAPEAAPVIQLMALTLPLAGLTVVPYAHLQREFMQSRLFAIDAVNFSLGTTVTLVLALDGHGPLSLAIGRVVGQVASTVLQFWVTRQPLRVGWRRDVAVSGIRFGLPLACAGLLSWTLLNIDTMVVGYVAGATALGFYVLAFNVSSWPSSVVGTAVKAVAFPAFAQRGREAGGRDAQGLVSATAFVWAGALPVAVALAVLAEPVVRLLYGTRWAPAAAALVGLAVFGALRVVFDLWVAYLTACGAAGALVWTQVAWIVALTPAMFLGLRWGGIEGAAWAHAAVAVVFMLPVYLITLRRYDVSVPAVLRKLLPALLAVVPAAFLGRLAVAATDGAFVQLLAGGLALVVPYAALIWPWLRRQRPPGPDSARPAEATVTDHVPNTDLTTSGAP